MVSVVVSGNKTVATAFQRDKRVPKAVKVAKGCNKGIRWKVPRAVKRVYFAVRT